MSEAKGGQEIHSIKQWLLEMSIQRQVVIHHEAIETGTRFRGQKIFLESTGSTEKDRIIAQRFNEIIERRTNDLNESMGFKRK